MTSLNPIFRIATMDEVIQLHTRWIAKAVRKRTLEP
jgi:ABC-type microcin C transport system duplicated ATPase subunit YejF